MQIRKYLSKFKKKQLPGIILIAILLVLLTTLLPFIVIPGIALLWFYKGSKFSKKVKAITTVSMVVILIGWVSIAYAQDPEPHLTITEPTVVSTTKAPQITIQGEFSPSDRTIEVNGQVITTSHGKFTTVYKLKEGANKIDVTAGQWKWVHVYLTVTRELTDAEKAARITPTATPKPTTTPIKKTSNTTKTKPTPTNKPKPTPTNKPKPTPTAIPSLSVYQKTQIVTIITANTNHFKQLWSDGQTALGTTQYADAYAGLDAINDPSSNASKFSQYKQTENPANDNSMNTALQQADKYYPSNVSDDALNTWRLDMITLSSDMGLWVNDATSWQISEIPTSQLNNDAQTVNKDFSTVEKDVQAIK